jgi:hypothetical protein
MGRDSPVPGSSPALRPPYDPLLIRARQQTSSTDLTSLLDSRKFRPTESQYHLTEER